MTDTSAFPIFDGHNDTLLDLFMPESGQSRSFFERSTFSHIDLPRALAGGFAGGFFAVFVPTPNHSLKLEDFATETGFDMPLPPPVEINHAQQQVMAMVALLFQLEKEAQGQIKVVRTVTEIEECMAQGIMAIILHFEGAEAIDEDFNALEVFYQAGLRSLGLVWSRPTAFGHGVPFRFPYSPDTGPGLTDKGKVLVKLCNQMGIMLDLSHLNEAGFWDVAKLSEAPLVATHSNVHALSPATRNLTDKQLTAIKESDGIVGLNFAVAFLREDGQENVDTLLETMLRHIDYLVEHVGLDRVGLGSDFDGAKVPQAIGDVSGLPNLVEAMRQHGYSTEELQKITHQNWLRVLGKTLKG